MHNKSDSHCSHFHAAEIEIQQRLGVSELVDKKTKLLIRDEMPEQHRDFFTHLPLITIAAIDKEGQPWSIPITGTPPFISSPNSRTLCIQHLPPLNDYLHLDISEGKKIGILGIDLSTRRRNRMNGIIKQKMDAGFSIHVEQSFGNCRRYIQQRTLTSTIQTIKPIDPKKVTNSFDISTHAKELIERADTFFIASRPQYLNNDIRHGLDASHRGGNPGFVKISHDNALYFPDFNGNQSFNTLGNIVSDGRVGLTFIDFSTGNSVLISGTASIVWETEENIDFEGAERFVKVCVNKVIEVPKFIPFTHQLIALSPTLQKTGVW